MPHPRPAGRHRQERLHRHRAAHRTLTALHTERGRTVALTATLSVALVTGVAGGSAAAVKAKPQHHAEAAWTTSYNSTETHGSTAPGNSTAPIGGADLGSTDSDGTDSGSTDFRGTDLDGTDFGGGLGGGLGGGTDFGGGFRGTDDFGPRDLAPARQSGRIASVRTHLTRAIPAAPAKRKERAVVITSPAGATWVNPNPAARVTSCFGPRWGRLHEGVDLAGPDGTPIVAAGAGVVVRAGVAQGYGNAVLIDHGDGWLTHYGHLSVIAVVPGQHVAAGQRIGDEGSTGRSTGPHLHFEVHQGFYQNPVEPTWWLHQHGVEIPGCPPIA